MLAMSMQTFLLILFILSIFYLMGMKNKTDSLTFSIFECGFSSYFYSRFSFSIHYLTISLIFLFLDLEICFILPYLTEDMNNFLFIFYFNLIVLILSAGLLKEWNEKKLEWEY